MLLSDRVAHERLSRICHCDYDRDMTLVAEHDDAKTGACTILGASRMTKMHGIDEARLSVQVSDSCQGLGLGGEMLRRAVQIARDEKLASITAFITPDNQLMQHLFQKLGFSLKRTSDGQLLEAKLDL
jgi:acetyltransferase